MQGSVYGILSRDIDGDDVPDAIVAQKSGPGFRMTVLRQVPGDPEPTWVAHCRGPLAEGVEIDTFRLVRLAEGVLLLVVASDENPDELVQWVQLVDPADCELRFSDRMRLPRFGEHVVASPAKRGGVLVEEPLVRLTDEPRLLSLKGADGDVPLLTAVRVRTLSGGRERVVVTEQREELLIGRGVSVRWLGSEPVDLGELVDGEPQTAFVLKSGEVGRIEIHADGPMALVELQHGCRGQGPVPLELVLAPADRYITGALPAEASLVLGRGRGHAEGDYWLDLVAVRGAPERLALEVSAQPVERCLREMRAFGFR